MKKLAKKVAKKSARHLPDVVYLYVNFIVKNRYFPRLIKWRSFNEYISYVKLFDHSQIRRLFVDRLGVREYVKSKAPEVSLIPILWIGVDFDELVFNSLPKKFVIKANHGSGMVKMFDKSRDSYSDLCSDIKRWFRTDYSKVCREKFYKHTPRILICEQMLGDGAPPPDFKFFVMNGKVEVVQIDLSRFNGHKRCMYSRDFTKLPVRLLYPDGGDVEKPAGYEKALVIAEKLSDDFPFLRIDLYIIGNEVFFGEITNAPGAGFERFTPREFDFELGNKIRSGLC